MTIDYFLSSELLETSGVEKRYSEKVILSKYLPMFFYKPNVLNILPKEEFLPYMDQILDFIKENQDDDDMTKFSDLEYERFRRVRDYFATTSYTDNRITEGRKDFYNWFTEYDRRRNVNFLETFPEMENFFNLCRDTV